MMGDDIITFPIFYTSSEITYYPHKVNDDVFHNFSIKNKLNAKTPKEMDDNPLLRRTFYLALGRVGEKLSYFKDIMVKDGEKISKEEMDKIINEMNGILFKFEEYTEKHNINLF